MNTPYLVQRGIQKLQPGRSGIDALIQFDYMGSAEFEWGSLPKSLKRMREDKEQYILSDVVLNHNDFTKRLSVWAKVNDTPDVLDWLHLVAQGNHRRCKEFIGLDAHFSKYSRSDLEYRLENFWWDIENDFFFWFSDEKFANNLIASL